MIQLIYNDTILDLAKSTSLSFEGISPILRRTEIPGTKIFGFNLLQTPRTRRALGLPEVLAAADRQRTWEKVQLKLEDTLWNIGTLKLRDSTNDNYSVSFHTDAADLAIKVKDLRLRQFNLGTDTADYDISKEYPTRNHTFPVIFNSKFYDGKNADYSGYINYYHSGSYVANPGGQRKYARCPAPYIMYLLNRIATQLGYFGINGPAANDARLLKAIVLSNRSLDSGTSSFLPTFNYADHMPDVSVGSFLIDICIAFGIYINVNPVTNYIELHYVKTPLINPEYVDYGRLAGRDYKIFPRQFAGIRFVNAEPKNDELFANKPAWLVAEYGGSAEQIQAEFTPIQVNAIDDFIHTKTWPVGTMESKGRSPEYEELGDNDIGLRLGFYQVLQDSASNNYPAITDTFDGLRLRFGGADGIVANYYEEYIDFKRNTELLERSIRITNAQFKEFNFARKVMVDHLKFMVDRIQASYSNDGGIQPVAFDLYSIKL